MLIDPVDRLTAPLEDQPANAVALVGVAAVDLALGDDRRDRGAHGEGRREPTMRHRALREQSRQLVLDLR